ncbi:MAG: tetratricopeptide repeat protein [bacterium]|nr:tetratricopeptide repeat protein [bacterium]
MIKRFLLLALFVWAALANAGVVDDRYNAALQKLQSGNRTNALSEMRALSLKYPNHPLAGNFHYWSGEALLGLDRPDEAQLEFLMAAAVPHSTKISHARFMLGMCYSRLGKKTLAKAEWERFMRDFPNDPLLPRVKERLALL